jgi:hypothetical protein
VRLLRRLPRPWGVDIDLVAIGLLVLLPFAFATLSGVAQVSFLARLTASYPHLAAEVGRAPSGWGAGVDRLTLRCWWVTPAGLQGERGLFTEAAIARVARVIWWVGLVVWPGVSVGLSVLLRADLVVGLALVPVWALTGPIAIRHDTVKELPGPGEKGNASGNVVAFYFLPALIVGMVLLALGLGWAVSEFQR